MMVPPALTRRYGGFHVRDARLGSVRIFDARVKIQHDAQWSVLMRASIFWCARHQRANPYWVWPRREKQVDQMAGGGGAATANLRQCAKWDIFSQNRLEACTLGGVTFLFGTCHHFLTKRPALHHWFTIERGTQRGGCWHCWMDLTWTQLTSAVSTARPFHSHCIFTKKYICQMNFGKTHFVSSSLVWLDPHGTIFFQTISLSELTIPNTLHQHSKELWISFLFIICARQLSKINFCSFLVRERDSEEFFQFLHSVLRSSLADWLCRSTFQCW